MASFGLVAKQRVRIGIGAELELLPFGVVELDASIEETHSFANEVTQFPVESGVDITDHVRRQPDRVTIKGMITDHPLIFGGALRDNVSLDAFGQFLVMMNEAQLVMVVTTLNQYQDFILESMEVPRNPKLSSAVEVTLVLREIQTTEVAVAAGTTDLGTQNPVPLT